MRNRLSAAIAAAFLALIGTRAGIKGGQTEP